MVDVSGGLVFTMIAGFALGMADARAAAILVIPLVGIGVMTRTLDGRIKAYRMADRAATEEVTGLLGDVMAAATTVKVNDASDSMLRRLAVLVERRRVTAVRDRVLEEGVMAFSQGAADIGLGLVLLVSAGAIASGSFDLGTLALFTAYLGWLASCPGWWDECCRGASRPVWRSTGCVNWLPTSRLPTPCGAASCRSILPTERSARTSNDRYAAHSTGSSSRTCALPTTVGRCCRASPSASVGGSSS